VPDIDLSHDIVETVSTAVHDQWMATKREQGVDSRQAEDGEELMVPYGALSEKAKDLDRGTVKATLSAIYAAGYRVVPA
jgi:hypothetical protein